MAGRKILVIGGSRGIGAEAVRKFINAGDDVVFTYHRSELAADALRQETGAVPVRCDVKFSNSVKIAVDKAIGILGYVDVLICNAAIYDFELLTDIEETRWEEVIDTNLNGTYYSIRNILPYMIQRKGGTIITVSSTPGQVGASSAVAYSAAKAGVIGLTKALAKEVEPYSVRVKCISPGMIETGIDDIPSETALSDTLDTPFYKTGKPEEIAAVMLFLASEEAGFITGQVIGVNGD